MLSQIRSFIIFEKYQIGIFQAIFFGQNVLQNISETRLRVKKINFKLNFVIYFGKIGVLSKIVESNTESLK